MPITVREELIGAPRKSPPALTRPAFPATGGNRRDSRGAEWPWDSGSVFCPLPAPWDHLGVGWCGETPQVGVSKGGRHFGGKAPPPTP